MVPWTSCSSIHPISRQTALLYFRFLCYYSIALGYLPSLCCHTRILVNLNLAPAKKMGGKNSYAFLANSFDNQMPDITSRLKFKKLRSRLSGQVIALLISSSNSVHASRLEGVAPEVYLRCITSAPTNHLLRFAYLNFAIYCDIRRNKK